MIYKENRGLSVLYVKSYYEEINKSHFIDDINVFL